MIVAHCEIAATFALDITLHCAKNTPGEPKSRLLAVPLEGPSTDQVRRHNLHRL